jgi:hypothetical protein
MAPGPNHTLFVAIPDGRTTVLTRLTVSGAIHRGWPIRVDGQCRVLAVPYNSQLRVVCSRPGKTSVAYSFDGSGSPQVGWPVTLDGYAYTWSEEPRLVGTDLFVLLHDDTGTSAPGHAWIAAMQSDGSVQIGARPAIPDPVIAEDGTPNPYHGVLTLGPDGRAYSVAYWTDGSSTPIAMTTITAFDLQGLVQGWSISIPGSATRPVFGADGSVQVVQGSEDRGPSRVLVFDASGRERAASPDLPVPATSDWSGAGSPLSLAPPVVSPDGLAFLVSSDRKTTIYAVDETTGTVRSGWPYHAPGSVQWAGYCGPRVAGCGYTRAAPQAGPDGTLYLSIEAVGPQGGGRIVAVSSGGRLRSGWPVTLRRAGAAFWSVAIGGSGTVYGLAVEPEAGSKLSATILAIAPDGTVQYRRTIIDP